MAFLQLASEARHIAGSKSSDPVDVDMQEDLGKSVRNHILSFSDAIHIDHTITDSEQTQIIRGGLGR